MQNKQSKWKNIIVIIYNINIASKLPSINSSIRLRRYSPLEISRITNIPKTRADSEHTKSTERSLKKYTLPSI